MCPPVLRSDNRSRLGVTAVRRVTTTLALALCLLGCSAAQSGGSAAPPSVPIELLTGVTACWAGGERPSLGLLLADPTYGTTFNAKPVMWPVGFTGLRLAGGEVAVLNRAGRVVATTGREYALSGAPVPEEKRRLIESIGALPVAGDCYPWDLIDCSSPAPGSSPSDVAELYCRPSPE